MTSSVTFETAAFADVIKNANRIAPTKGAAFDKAAGIVLAFDPSSTVPLATVRATNLDLFSIEWVNVTAMQGEPAQWRLPSLVTSMVIGSLPIGTGKTVTLTSEENDFGYHVNLKSGRTKARFYPLDISYYPEWSAFDPDMLFPAKDLGGRIAQVEWAAGKSDPKLAGVYLDGENAIATDSYRLARVPLSIPDLKEPIVVPAGLLGQTIRATGEIKIGVADHMFQIMPDDYTQIKTVIFSVQYPKVQSIIDLEFTHQMQIKRDDLLTIMNRANAFSQGDRMSALQIFIGREEVNIIVVNEQIGKIQDVIEVPGFADHDRFEIRMSSKNIMEPLQKAPNNDLTISYNLMDSKSPIRIDGGSGYLAWVVPRVNLEPEDA